MQVYMGSEVTSIPKNFGEKMGRLKLRQSKLQLKQFDGSVIKTLGCFEEVFKMKSRFEVIPFVVVECINNHGLLGVGILRIDTSKLINFIKLEEPAIRLYEVSVQLKENSRRIYFQSYEVLVHLLPMVMVKRNKMIKQGILVKVSQGGSNWASPIVAICKTNGDLRICGYYKVDVNHQICLDAFPLPNTEMACHEFACMKVFAKIGLEFAYNQIKIDDYSQEVTMLNTSMFSKVDLSAIWN